jgi:hypothetical protein
MTLRNISTGVANIFLQRQSVNEKDQTGLLFRFKISMGGPYGSPFLFADGLLEISAKIG